MVGELGSAKSFQMDNNDHTSLSESDAATENEHLSEEKVNPSSHAIRWNSQRSQSYSTLNSMARRHVMETRDPTHFQKQIHTHVDWKASSSGNSHQALFQISAIPKGYLQVSPEV
ncbi:hypothetical protein JHK87_016256 [Glycine soja]|nr:hypothetical protein JHK87_016256 [Glycine soja]